MKGWLVLRRFAWGFFVIPIFVAGCMGTINESVVHDVGLTQTAWASTPIPISTPHPSEKLIADILNVHLLIPEHPLSKTIDASYEVVDVDFHPNRAGVPDKFTISVLCECALNGGCCNVEHSFVIIIQAMKANSEILLGVPLTIPSVVPDTVTEFQVDCFDHSARLGMMYVPWPILREYLAGNISGDQFGWAVEKNKTPEP